MSKPIIINSSQDFGLINIENLLKHIQAIEKVVLEQGLRIINRSFSIESNLHPVPIVFDNHKRMLYKVAYGFLNSRRGERIEVLYTLSLRPARGRGKPIFSTKKLLIAERAPEVSQCWQEDAKGLTLVNLIKSHKVLKIMKSQPSDRDELSSFCLVGSDKRVLSAANQVIKKIDNGELKGLHYQIIKDYKEVSRFSSKVTEEVLTSIKYLSNMVDLDSWAKRFVD